MREMNNIEYNYIVKEFSNLIGKHFNKFYKVKEDFFRLKIENINIAIEIPKRIFITKKIIKESINDNFVSGIRKNLKNKKITNIYQLNNDRIIIFEFSNMELIFEFFSDGNIILTEDKKIKHFLKKGKWKDREIRYGVVYKPPPSKFVDSLEEAISEKYIIVCLMKLPLGKIYAKAILKECGIDEKKPGNKLNENEINCIKEKIKKLKESLKPYAFYENGRIIDYGLYKFPQYSEYEEKETLSEILDEFDTIQYEESKALKKIKIRLKKQKETLEKYKKIEEEERKKGDWIKENYNKIEKIYEFYKKYGVNRLEEELKGVAKIDKKNKKIIFEI